MKGTIMKILEISPTKAVITVEVQDGRGNITARRRARAELRNGMWYLYPKAGVDYAYTSQLLARVASAFESDIITGRKIWEI
jgi:hypothetical protein